jgi:biopolymer transport protein ExbD
MAFGRFDQDAHQPMSEINVTPLVDVMLVLLVIFIVTTPLFTHAVRINLPQAAAQPMPQKPETVTLAIDERGLVYWNREPIALAELRARLAQPDVRLYADKAPRYQELAQVMAAAQNAGLQKMGFITDPNGAPR